MGAQRYPTPNLSYTVRTTVNSKSCLIGEHKQRKPGSDNDSSTYLCPSVLARSGHCMRFASSIGARTYARRQRRTMTDGVCRPTPTLTLTSPRAKPKASITPTTYITRLSHLLSHARARADARAHVHAHAQTCTWPPRTCICTSPSIVVSFLISEDPDIVLGTWIH